MSAREVSKRSVGRFAFVAVATSLLAVSLVYYLTEPQHHAAALREQAGMVKTSSSPERATSSLSPMEAGDVQVLPSGADGVVLVPELKSVATRLNQSDSTIDQDLEVLETLIEGFRRWNQGANPLGGENEEIVAQLSGRNAKHLAVLPLDHPAINSHGQLVDRWGTPFFFHPLSRTALEVRSAGPDRRLFTEDDRKHEG